MHKDFDAIHPCDYTCSKRLTTLQAGDPYERAERLLKWKTANIPVGCQLFWDSFSKPKLQVNLEHSLGTVEKVPGEFKKQNKNRLKHNNPCPYEGVLGTRRWNPYDGVSAGPIVFHHVLVSWSSYQTVSRGSSLCVVDELEPFFFWKKKLINLFFIEKKF